jgi:alkanesulfonate monooxygenase
VLVGGYVEAVLRRAATRGDGWLTYFYTPDSFTRGWAKVRAFAREAGRDPAQLRATNQLAIHVGRSRDETATDMRHWLQTEWDTAAWSESTIEHAIHGSPAQCVEQLRAHVQTGVDRIVLIPYRYRSEQVERIATEVLPRL